MRDGEGGDLNEDRLELRRQQKNAQHEKDVIESLRYDVQESELQILPNDLDIGRGPEVGPRRRGFSSAVLLQEMILSIVVSNGKAT